MSTPQFSVVIPAFNRAHMLPMAIASIQAQTVQDFEIIVVDDGSSDNTQDAVEKLGDNRIHYIFQDNAGANLARNNGISCSRGKYVALLDSDDKFLPHHLETAAKTLGDDKAAYFARVIADRGGGRTFLKPPRGPRPNEPLSEYLCCDMGFVQTSTLVLHHSVAKEIQYLDWLPYGQDVDYALRIIAAGYDLRYADQADAVWNDIQNGRRISSGSRGPIRDRWAEENSHLLTKRALAGFRGWRSAKAYAEGGEMLKGLKLFARAAATGAYPPKHAARVFLQVALANGGYQKIAGLLFKSGK
ncbi:glycosyltransferase family 2 protein [Sphingobium yanoikuyae]|uniref:glycosyltransferase family 2 protein n=1 Tax=Sphingobium yanoikuyae TaxID=13690 RepID=UPI00293D00C6|nr:glycosyltransferase [Sphingobium yanoikuyae]MDV3482254.1 glycosyltransferase [Sphingobium yanoikuyae]